MRGLVEGQVPLGEWKDRLLADPRLAGELGAAAAARARTYTWSTAAARLRRTYHDLTSRVPVSCAA